MKKITTLLLLLLAAIVLVMPAYADEETLVDLYPYNDQGALYGPTTPHTLVGDSNWDLEFLGHRYHIVRGGVRFAHQFVDANSDGILQPTEYTTSLTWPSFSLLTINDGTDDLKFSSTNIRTDITGNVIHRIYAYFNENNELVMFEDHIFQYYIHNDGTDVLDNADWRLATTAEKDAFIAAADPLVDTPNTRYAHVRIIRDETDTDGYVLEPIKYLTWVNDDMSKVTPAIPVQEQSLLLDRDPSELHIPAGWSVFSVSSNDRGTLNTKTTDWVKTFAGTFESAEAPIMEAVYTNPGLTFNNLSAHDDDISTDGIQMIVTHREEGFNLPNNITVTRTKMYDETNTIINEVEKLSYTVKVYGSVDFYSSEDDHVPTALQTIEFVYDEETDKYTPSAALSVVDSSVFGAGYVAVYSVDHPEEGLVEKEVSIAVGVLPPKFENVKNRFVDEGVFVDLLGDITANDGYGGDKTSSIKVTPPAGFNIYNTKAGEHIINLEFDHVVEVEGEITPDRITIGETVIDVTRKNVVTSTYSSHTTLYTEPFLYTNTSFQGFTVVEFDADGKMVKSVVRNTWVTYGEEGLLPNSSDATIKTWLEGIDFEEGGFVVFFGTAAGRPLAEALRFGDEVTFTEGSQAPSTFVTLTTKASYKLTVDDKTAPTAIVIDDQYTIEADAYTTANAAILANVIGVDNFDSKSDLSIYVVENGGLSATNGKLAVGTYNVEVAVEDRAGNIDEVSFTVKVIAPKPTQEEVDQKVDEKVEDVEAQIPQDTITPDQVEEAIQDALDSYDGVSVLTAVLMSLGAALVSFGGAALLFFLKKK